MAPVMKEEDENDDEEVDPPKINLKKEVRIGHLNKIQDIWYARKAQW